MLNRKYEVMSEGTEMRESTMTEQETQEQMEARLCAEHGITKQADGSYKVPSSRPGKSYIVQYEGSGDADPEFVALWSCTCPAGAYGRTCKHVNMVSTINDEICDEFGLA